MSQELIYTSAPRGLKPGSRGFCTVQSTQGMARNLADQLENLSGYRHVFPPHDPQAALNPVAWSHWKLTVGGRPMHVLSRIADAGLDYTQRTNKFVHHVVLDPNELVPAGPAWLLGSGLMQTDWDGTPRILPRGRAIPSAEVRPAVCQTWKAMTGDAGWAGVLAATAAAGANQQAVIVFRPGMDLLPLLAEAVALLPPADRWGVTFTTYFTRLPPGVNCNWRCVLADSPEALAATRTPHAVVIDLCRPLGHAPASALVESARTGQKVAALWDRKEPASQPPVDMAPLRPEEQQLLAALGEEPGPATPPPRRSASDEQLPVGPPPRAASRPAHLPAVFDREPAPRRSPMPWIAVGVSALLLAASGGAAIWTYFNVTSAQQIAQQETNGKEKAQQPKEPKPEPKPQAEVTEPAPSAPEPAKPDGGEPAPSEQPMGENTPPAGAEPSADPMPTPSGNGGSPGDKPSQPTETAPAPPANPAVQPQVKNNTADPPKKEASPERNPFEGFPRSAERRGNQWKIDISNSIPNIDAVYLLGTPQFYKDKLFKIQQGGEPTPKVSTWNIIYEDKTAGLSEMTVGWITFHTSNQAQYIDISFKINGECIDYIETGGLALVSGAHSHEILLHNPQRYFRTTPGNRTHQDLQPFRPNQTPGNFRPSGISDMHWPELATWTVHWGLTHDGTKLPATGTTTAQETPIQGRKHVAVYSLEIKGGNNRLTIIPQLKLDIIVPTIIQQSEQAPATAKTIGAQLTSWSKNLPRHESAQRNKVDEADKALNAEEDKKKDNSPDKISKLKAELKKEQQLLQDILDFQEDIKTLEKYMDKVFSTGSDLRIDYDIYAVVSDPRDKSQQLEMLMYTTDPDWQQRPVVRPVSTETSE